MFCSRNQFGFSVGVIKGTVYVQGLNSSIFIFFHKNKVFTVTFQTNKNGVWVRCLFVW